MAGMCSVDASCWVGSLQLVYIGRTKETKATKGHAGLSGVFFNLFPDDEPAGLSCAQAGYDDWEGYEALVISAAIWRQVARKCEVETGNLSFHLAGLLYCSPTAKVLSSTDRSCAGR